MVRFKAKLDDIIKSPNTFFNSYMVRFKVGPDAHAQSTIIFFNSYMVRFKVAYNYKLKYLHSFSIPIWFDLKNFRGLQS